MHNPSRWLTAVAVPLTLSLLSACGPSQPAPALPTITLVPATPVPFLPTEAPSATPTETQVEPVPTPSPTETPPPTAIPTDPPPPTEALPVVLAQGQFTQIDAQHYGQGTASLLSQADGTLTLTFTSFSVVNAPDMRVYLSPQADPRTSAALGTDYLDLGPLQSISGDQTYTLPPGTDASRYHSVVIYCVPFTVVVSTAPF